MVVLKQIFSILAVSPQSHSPYAIAFVILFSGLRVFISGRWPVLPGLRLFLPGRWLFFLGLWLLFLGLWAVGCRDIGSGPSADALRRATETSSAPVRIGTSGDYPPFSEWPRGEAEPRGFSVDVARAYASSRDRQIDWVRFRWPELLRDLESGRFDLALSGVTVRADRSVAGRFSLPLTTSGAVVLVEASSDLRSADDLLRPGLLLAVNAGGHLERVARTLLSEARIEPVAQNERVLDRLGGDGVAAVMTDTLEAPIWRSKRPGLRAIGPLTRDRKAAWFPKTDEAEVRRFDRWLLRAEASGLLARLRTTHGLPKSRTARPLEALLARLDERLSLMVAVARAKQTLGSEVEDLAREARVLESATASVQRTAAQEGTRPPDDEAIRRLYRAQIEAAKWIQRNRLDSPKATASAAKDSTRAKARSNLDERLRPALIFLGDRIATLVVLASNDRPIDLRYAELSRALSRHDLPKAHLHALYDALIGLSTPR